MHRAHPPKAIQTFLKHAPPPNMLAMPAVGIDISDRALRYVFLARDRTARRVGFYGKYDLSEAALQRGDITQADEIKEALSYIRDRHDVRMARLALPEARSYLFRTAIPASADVSEGRTIIEFELEEHVPLSPEEVEFDYQPIRTRGSETEVAVSVFPKRIISRYVEVLSEVDIVPLSLEIEPHAVARAVLPPSGTGTYFVANIGDVRTSVTVAQEGVVHYTASLDGGAQEMASSIAEEVGCEEAQAREALWERGIRDGGDETAIVRAAQRSAQRLQRKIERHCAFWNDQAAREEPGHVPIEHMYVTGPYASLPGLVEYFSATLPLPVSQANVWGNAFSLSDTVPPIPAREASGYAAAIGLAERVSGID